MESFSAADSVLVAEGGGGSDSLSFNIYRDKKMYHCNANFFFSLLVLSG